MLASVLLRFILLLPTCALVGAMVARKFVELPPAKGMMLAKTWQALLKDADAFTIVPDGKSGKKLKAVPIQGDEVARRKLCRQQLQLLQEATQEMVAADLSDYPRAKRQLIETLRLGGAPRGANTKCFVSLPVNGSGATTLSLVETLDAHWSVLALCVRPDEKQLPGIVEAEAATLDALRGLCTSEGAALSVLSDAAASFAASWERLALTASAPDGIQSMWLRCASPSEAGGASQLVEDDPAAALFEWASRGGAYVSEALRLSVESAKRPRGLVISATDVPAGTFSLSALRDMNGIPELTRVTACTGLTGLSCLQAPCF
jgi:hypothetical protein